MGSGQPLNGELRNGVIFQIRELSTNATFVDGRTEAINGTDQSDSENVVTPFRVAGWVAKPGGYEYTTTSSEPVNDATYPPYERWSREKTELEVKVTDVRHEGDTPTPLSSVLARSCRVNTNVAYDSPKKFSVTFKCTAIDPRVNHV